MYYEVFPFGKYKGVKLTELPSTYIVLALEKFELPDELYCELKFILFGRFNIYSFIGYINKNKTKKEIKDFISNLSYKYENENE